MKDLIPDNINAEEYEKEFAKKYPDIYEKITKTSSFEEQIEKLKIVAQADVMIIKSRTFNSFRNFFFLAFLTVSIFMIHNMIGLLIFGAFLFLVDSFVFEEVMEKMIDVERIILVGMLGQTIELGKKIAQKTQVINKPTEEPIEKNKEKTL